MNFKVQRFSKGHEFYSDKIILHEEKEYQSVFGQIVNAETNEFICHSLERRDTLIPEGVYPFTFYHSPANRCEVPLLENIPGFSFVEWHPANWAYQLKACCAPGMSINLAIPQVSQSRNAFNIIMGLMNGEKGKITYETLINNLV